MYEFNAVRIDNPNAQFGCWDTTLEAGFLRMAERYGVQEMKNYTITVSKRTESGEWVEL